MLYRLLQKGPTVLGAQASSPARVPPNQQPLTELVPLNAGRRGRLRSQDRGAILQAAIQLVVTQPNEAPGSDLLITEGLVWLLHDKKKHIGRRRLTTTI